MKKTRYLYSALLLALASGPVGADLTGLVNSVGDFAKGVGQKAGQAIEQVGKSAGVGLTAAEIEQRAKAALEKLYQSSPKAKELAQKAKAILVFPEVLKAGAGIGGSYGEGVLFKHGSPAGFYSIAAASYGMQLGAQSYGYAMFFMDDKSLEYLDKNDGWEVGTGPSIVLVDKGMATTTTNTTMNSSVYVFTFSQKGLMAGTGIQGSKISRITPER
jgi:lipid-binding SYLF domain-containing protein